jgi:uncharacterized RDD family membrane protein YckC
MVGDVILEMKSVAGAKLKIRIRALLWDWIFISLYLIALLFVTLLFYYFVLGSIPIFSETQSQWVAFMASILPIICIFTFWECKRPYASIGKRNIGLMVRYRHSPIRGSIIRNILKFLPWQLGHMATIRGMYSGYESTLTLVLYGLSVLLPLVYILMVATRKDHRHLPDIMAGSFVVIEND